ncbi:MAG: hypothetical protein AB1725_07290 [Armatimonadota bacterium]
MTVGLLRLLGAEERLADFASRNASAEEDERAEAYPALSLA